MLLRLLFPSWAFFDAVTEVPSLEVRVCVDGAWESWRSAITAPPRTLRSLVYHPRGTLHLAAQSVVDRLAFECEHGSPDAITTALVERVAARAVEQQAVGASHFSWAWRVVATRVHEPATAAHVLHEAIVPAERA